MVTAVITADVAGVRGGQITALKIAKDAIDPEDPEMLEDLITTAVNEAGKKADEMVQKSMSQVTGGLGLPGGMF